MAIRLLVALSARNLFRHRRRNFMLLLAICVAVAGVVLMNALIRGYQGDMQVMAVENLTGHLKVLAPGYRDDPGVAQRFELADDWQPDVPEEALAGWAPRLRVPAVVMSERDTRGVQLVGVDPAREDISFLSHVAVEGERLADLDDRRIVVGRALAEQLRTDVGYRLVIITQGADGLNREAGFRIAGLYDAEGTGLEKTFVFTGMRYLQGILDTDGVTEVSIRLREDPDTTVLQQRVEQEFSGLEVFSWQQLEPQAAAMFAMADTSMFILFLVMMGALVFGLVNTLITAVMERTRELGLLRALGMPAGSVVMQVVLECSLIMAAGVAAGLGLGVLLVGWFGDGIDLSEWAEGMEMAGMRSVITPDLQGADLLMVAMLSLGLGVLASLYPAWRAVKVKPLEALRR